MSTPKEIERKFWVYQLPDFVLQLPCSKVMQGYLSLDPNGKEVRLRQKDDTYWLTVKTSGTLERSEYETALTEQQFKLLWPAVEDKIIHKTRYIWQKAAVLIEIDVYLQPLKGLIVAEIEFEDTKKALQYMPEPWMSKDITHLNFMKNKNLLQFEDFEQIKQLL